MKIMSTDEFSKEEKKSETEIQLYVIQIYYITK